MTPNANSVLNFLASAGPLARATVTGPECDEIMEQTGGEILARGALYRIKSRRLSPKVYSLSLTRFRS
jgi:hypothetical protein